MGEVPHRQLKIILYAGFTFFEFLLFAFFIYLNIKSPLRKKSMLLIGLFFLIFIPVYYLTVKFKRIDSIPIGIETILIFVFAFYYLYESINDQTTLFVYSKPSFWIIISMVLYLAGSFFIYIFAANLTREEGQKYWWITNIFTIIKNLIFCIGILLHVHPSKEENLYKTDLSRL